MLLAHHIKFDDNKLMINKIKDFLKNKLARRQSQDLINQVYGDDTDDTRLPDNNATRTRIQSPDEFEDKPSRFKNLFGKFKVSLPKKSSSDGPSILSPSLTRSIEKFLSREAREPFHQLFLVLFICSITYFLGKVTALALKGTPKFDAVKRDVVSIPLDQDFDPQTLTQVKRINPFKTNTGATAKKKLADTKCEAPQQASNLPIKLVNTVVLQDTVKSLASVQVRGDRALQEVRVGDQISNLAKIFKITRLELLVKNLESGVCESITSDKAGNDRRSSLAVMSLTQAKEFKKNLKMPGIENVGNKFNISKKLLDEKLKDIASILTQARALKIQNPDGTMAFKLTEMDPQGIFPYLGLQDQDIITSINGKPIYDMNEVMTLFGRIKNLESLSLGVRRDGSESVQEYSIKK